jgi:hypothetical protein
MMNRRVFLMSMAGAIAPVVVSADVVDWRPRDARGPADVLLMRHAEEPDSGPHLNDRGRERARALVKLFPARFAKPTALFAATSTKQSSRPVETITPLADATGLRVRDEFSNERFGALALHLLSDAQYAGGHIVVCWHRETLPDLAMALGVASPPRWRASVYDHVWFVTFTKATPALSDQSERLLPGDQ